jgi:peptide deformylase
MDFKESQLKIRIFGDPLLRKRARLIKEITQAYRDTLSHMAQLMYDSQGIGLAANQVGINESMAVIDIGSGLYKLINPKITEKEGIEAQEEGCLSVPGVCIKVKRARRVKVKARDEFGKSVEINAEGLLARVFQHEIDHLKGRLIIDYASIFQKFKISKTLEELKERSKRLKEKSTLETKTCKLQL